MKNIPIRKEEKFVIGKKDYQELLSFLLEKLKYDSYCKNGQNYTIQCLYFDSEDNHLIRTSNNKPKFREKIRLRKYVNYEFYFLELKRKVQGIGYKRRVGLSKDEAKNFIENGVTPLAKSPHEEQTIRELQFFLSRNKVVPKIILRYDRVALMNKVGDPYMRVTLDFNVAYKNKDIIFEDMEGYENLIDDDQVIMEVKVGDALPIWLVNKLSSMKIYGVSFSKYGNAYNKSIRNGDIKYD